MDPSAANAPKAVAAIGLVLTLPSLYVRLTILGDLLAGDIGSLESKLSNAPLFGYLGLAGTLLAIGALVYYFTKGRSEYEIPESTQYVTPEPEPSDSSTISKPPPIKETVPVVQEAPAVAWLVVNTGPRSGTQHRLSAKSQKKIGRDPASSDIILDDDTVSREHAKIRYENGQFFLYDLGSTTGTFVNGNRIERQMLYDADHIGVGKVELIYKKV
jgi:hypothetical protein